MFDLDETLVHCDLKGSLRKIGSSVTVVITLPNKDKVEVSQPLTPQAHVNIRPHAKELIKNMSKIFEVGVFTASHYCYAEEVVRNLDPNGEYISFLLTRKNCVEIDTSVFVKDLRVLQYRELENIILIDNAAYSYGLQLDNGIPCVPFYDNPEDKELFKLEEYLKVLAESENCLEFNKKYFKNFLLANQDSVENLMQEFVK